MIRLLIAGAIAYAAYRITKNMIDDVPGDFDPFIPPRDERAARGRRSPAMGTEPKG